MTRSRTVRGSLVAVVAALGLTACTAHPGVAAVVGSQQIGQNRLDDVATALCTAQNLSSGIPQKLSSRAARQGALDVLINGLLSSEFGQATGIRPSQGQVSAALAANQQTLNALPADERSAFENTLREYAEGQLIVVEAGRRALVSHGTSNPTQEQALVAGRQVRDAWARRHAPVTVNPRYGRFVNGQLQPSSGSLSVAASADAVAGASSTPGQSWVNTLPANQKCG